LPERLRPTESAAWRAWLRHFGTVVRGMRELLGLTQEQFAKVAHVSQGAVSRLERGSALSTPLIIAVKIRVALAAELRKLDPDVLTPGARRFLERVTGGYGEHEDAATPPRREWRLEILPAPELTALVRGYSRLPESARTKFLAIMSAVAATLEHPNA
jgi:transcriptional regulator with XRE-family HTH domain